MISDSKKVFVHGFSNQSGRWRLTSCTKHSNDLYELEFRNGENGTSCYLDNNLTFKTGAGQCITVEQAYNIINADAT
jgi:hypothetical protein